MARRTSWSRSLGRSGARTLGGRRILAQPLQGDRSRLWPVERTNPGQQFVEDDTEGIDIGGWTDRRPEDLLRAAVLDRPEEQARLGGARVPEGSGNPEVHDPHVTMRR